MPRKRKGNLLSTFTEPQLRWLRWFFLQGGSGVIDTRGCVLAGRGERSASGTQGLCLVLLSRGLLAVQGARIAITPAGNEVIAEIQRRRDFRGLEEAAQ